MLSSNTCVSDDPARGGCEFSRFFLTTPSDLIEDGLYKVLAFAAYPAAKHRKVSLMLLAMSLGATDVTHSIENSLKDVARVRSMWRMGMPSVSIVSNKAPNRRTTTSGRASDSAPTSREDEPSIEVVSSLQV